MKHTGKEWRNLFGALGDCLVIPRPVGMTPRNDRQALLTQPVFPPSLFEIVSMAMGVSMDPASPA